MSHKKQIRIVFCTLLLTIQATSPFTFSSGYSAENAASTQPLPLIHVPYLTGLPFMPAIFWFGKVDETNNYADVRLYYYDIYLTVVVTIIDRQVWYDTSPSAVELPNWDAVSLYIDLNGNTYTNLSDNSYLFRSEIGFQAGYHWNGSSWSFFMDSFISDAGGRGYPNSNLDDKGWQVEFKIPFTSLGLSGPPTEATSWGFAVVLHDRDDASGSIFHNTYWPEAANVNSPETWGQLNLGNQPASIPSALPNELITIRQGLNGAQVIDGHVGGRTDCGENLDHWLQWGNKNYAGDTIMNIQNQWDVSDYPCFSKYYLTFPLPDSPAGKVLISATLSMTLFGNSGGGVYGTPPDSYIQVFQVSQDWNETTLTWNNAPLVQENISGTWVYPRNYALPYETYNWDVSKGVNLSYQSGTPLRLAMYSADGEMHSGKYFYTSDSIDWAGDTRPTLRLLWGESCDAPGMVCNFIYLPTLKK